MNSEDDHLIDEKKKTELDIEEKLRKLKSAQQVFVHAEVGTLDVAKAHITNELIKVEVLLLFIFKPF